MLLRTNNLSVETLYSIDIHDTRIVGGSTLQLACCDPTKCQRGFLISATITLFGQCIGLVFSQIEILCIQNRKAVSGIALPIGIT